MNPSPNIGIKKKQALTIKAQRLAGSDACLNCGTALQGAFCHYCGQPDKRILRFFPVLLRELLEDIADFDSRFARTMRPLLFRPGKLTRDYLDGRRFRYTPPLRLYLFSSVILFVLAALTTNWALSLDELDITADDRGNVTFNVGNDEQPAARTPPENAADAGSEAETTASATDGDAVPWYESEGNEVTIFGTRPWHPETNPVRILFAPERLNRWINEELKKSPEKGKMIAENPRLIVNEIIDLLPKVMFVLLPVFALIMKLFYAFAKRFYVEHLMFSLHNHSFINVVFILAILLSLAEEGVEGSNLSWLSTPVSYLVLALMIWVPVYLLFALKRTYRQGWLMTAAKYLLVGVSYSAILILTTALIGLISFLKV